MPLGFDLEKFHLNRDENRKKTRLQFDIQEDEIAIGIIGRLAPIKNHSFFIDVLKEVALQTSKKIKVFVVGDGTEKETIQQQVTDFVWPDHVKIVFTSWVKEIDVFNPGMDIICLCSKNEGTPVSLIEAQAANVAVLSTDVGGVRDVVSDKKTGFIVTPESKSEYKEKLLLLIEDDALRKQISDAGWDYVKDNFHYTRLVKDVKMLYFKLLKDKNEI